MNNLIDEGKDKGSKRARPRGYTEEDLQVPDLRTDHIGYINLTTHANFFADPIPLDWGNARALERGPVVATTRHPMQRNAIGAHSGSYCVYKALAVASGALDPNYLPKMALTVPVVDIGPFPKQWSDVSKIATIDPFGHLTVEKYGAYLRKGYDIRPTIAVTEAHIDLPEVKEAVRLGRLKPDGKVLLDGGQAKITKCAVEPVWYLPEIARRFGCSEMALRESLFLETNMMFPELVTRPDMKVFLPPIGGLTIYIFGCVESIPDESIPLTVRVHDECNGSDVFGSDICTCRPYLTHAIEECIKTAQQGGTGVVIYFRKEGRSLGEVTKYLVYNMRKRQEGGDTAEKYFDCTEQVAGVQDTRFQALMPDPLHWLGVTKIDRFVSMSDMKYNAIINSGIKIVERIEIPPELVPRDAQVEITAKVFEGYHGGDAYTPLDAEALKLVKGAKYTYSKNGRTEEDGLTGGEGGAKGGADA